MGAEARLQQQEQRTHHSNMVDYAIDETFNLDRSEWDDFRTVDGLEEFEQDIAIQIHFRMQELLSTVAGSNTIKEKIRAEIYRIAQNHEVIDRIRGVEINKTRNTEGRYSVVVSYISDEPFSEVF